MTLDLLSSLSFSEEKFAPYSNLMGYWQVSTESFKTDGMDVLGIYEGYVDEIAFSLADRCNRTLVFKKIPHLHPPIPSVAVDKIDIQFDIESSTWGLSSKKLTELLQEIFITRDNINVVESSDVGCVTLMRKTTDDIKRRIALSKLTEEEKQLLGISNT